MPDFETSLLSTDLLILDPNNYRFHDDPNFVIAAEHRRHEEPVQNRAFRKLKEDGLLELKNSILTNGFMPVEPLVVREYGHADNMYLVIEGNRRLAALKWIRSDYHEGGVEVDPKILATLNEVPVVIVSHEEEDPAFFEALMGVRHVSGIKQWGGYQRAKLVAVLKDQRNMVPTEIADRLALSTREVYRRYRAYKVLEQMQQDEEFTESASARKYALFYEAVASPVIREWLGWDPDKSIFTNDEERLNFYELISGRTEDENGDVPPKLRTNTDVRELRYILVNDEAKEVLLDPDRSFVESVAIAKEDQFSKAWTSKIKSAISAIENIGYRELKSLNETNLKLLNDVSKIAISVVQAHERLKEDPDNK